MSRAERLIIPPRPRIGGAIRLAAVDLYYHGVRLVVVNVAWGVALLLTAFVLTRSLVGLLFLVATIPVTAGLMGMATRLVRHGHLVLSDFGEAVRHRFLTHLGVGLAQLALLAVAFVDLLVGMRVPGPLGVILAVTALYTAAAVWILAVSTWPILLDPLRADDPVRGKLRLGLLLALAHPLRIGGLALLLVAFLAVSAVFAAALVTVSGAFAFLVAARYVLPAADRLESRATLEAAPED